MFAIQQSGFFVSESQAGLMAGKIQLVKSLVPAVCFYEAI